MTTGLPRVPGLSTEEVRAFALLYDQEWGRLAGYLASLTGESEVARDAAQEAFTRLFARWRGVHEPRAFLYVVATNVVRHHWRRTTRERGVLTTLRVTTQQHQSPHEPWLRDLVERLPVRLREVVLLHYYADLPVTDLARAVNRPEGTIKRRLHEARQLLGLHATQEEEP